MNKKKERNHFLNQYFEKFKEALTSILPVSALVVILALTPIFNLTGNEIALFIVSTVLLIIGITLFNLGADVAMGEMGKEVGSSLTKTKKPLLVAFILFLMGVLITIAEPDLSVLARQLSNVFAVMKFEIVIGLGVGIFLVIGVMKVIYRFDLPPIIMVSYLLIFMTVSLLLYRGEGNFLAVAFDSGGVTTGPITVPFIIALGVGMSSAVGGRGWKENSFGIVALCSVGPILASQIMGLGSGTSSLSANDLFDLSNYSFQSTFGEFFTELGHIFISQMGNVAISLSLIVVFFLVINFIFIKLPKKELLNIGLGVINTFFGLVIFLTAAEIGFLPIGFKLGVDLASKPVVAIILAFAIGFLTVLAEPAVHVLTNQVEEVTTGAISRKSILIALCIGVGTSILLSILRIIFDFSILYYLIPGYLISLALSIMVPKIYTAIAFDSGGVASGPLTSSFVLPFAIGFCSITQPEKLLEDAFGIVAMVAMTPLITIQLLGFTSIITKQRKRSSRMKALANIENDDIIIRF